jgi:hypothetical protein
MGPRCGRSSRALVVGLMGSGMDLSGFGTEEDITADIQERLKG